MRVDLPDTWRLVLGGELEQPYFSELSAFVDGERAAHDVFPPEDDVFAAFKATPFERVSVLILGQDPYHDEGQAHGLAFSVRPGVAPPPSLANVFRELERDVPGFVRPRHGSLVRWAEQGVLLLNAVLTVRAHEPNSHRDKGWERFTDAVIRALGARSAPVVFVLWGGHARKKLKLIDARRHPVVTSAHPSPLSASAGFFGSRPFSKVNAVLAERGVREIDWRLPLEVDGETLGGRRAEATSRAPRRRAGT